MTEKNSVNPTVRTLYISMCKGGGSPYKLVGTEEKSRILLGTFGGCFPKLSIFLRFLCSASCKFFVKWSKPHCPPTYSATPCVKNQTKSLPSMGYISFVRVRLPSLSKSFQPSHKRSPWKSDKNLGDPSLTRSEHQYFEHTVLSRHRPPFRPPARSNARPPACQTAVCLPA
jgi:hypothetical protein